MPAATGSGEQRQRDPGGTDRTAVAAEHQHGEPGERADHCGESAAAQPLPHGQPRTDRDEHGPRTQRDHGPDREAGRLHGREVRALEHGEADAGPEDAQQPTPP